MASSARIREPHRPLLFALALLINVGLFQLLMISRPSRPEAPERRAVLVFVPDVSKPRIPPPEGAPLAPPRLPETSPPTSLPPELIAPPEDDTARELPAIDWHREAEQAAREHALAAEAGREPKDGSGPEEPQPEFGWSHSRIHRIEPMESGGFIVWISDNCFIVIGVMAMPMCKLGRKPARGDLFERMDDPPTPGDWKND